jgi:signal transduction histidine kinase
MQIRSRLTLQFIIIVAVIMVVALFSIHVEFGKQVRDDFYSGLKSKAIMTADMIVGQSIKSPVRNSEFIQNTNIPAYTENITIYNMANERVYSFNPMPKELDESILKEIRKFGEARFNNDQYSALGIVYYDKLRNPFVVVSEAVFKSDHLNDLNNILLIVFLLFIALVAIGGWIFAGQALSPVNHIMNQVDELLPSDMSHRLKFFNQNDELSRLVITFNKLLDRIQKAFTTQKLFLSNISHELKNPLSVIISQIEVTLQKERRVSEYKDTLSSILEDVKDLNEVSNKLLQLARINADNTIVDLQWIRIDELVWQLKSNILKSHPEYKINFEILNLPDNEDQLKIHANEPLIKTAILNLLDNGCKFSPDGRVQLRLTYEAGSGNVLEIEDNGPGIREEDLPYIFEPFYRSPATATVRGSGIGLSLVTSILKMHKVNLEIIRPKSQGTIFRLVFPGTHTHTENKVQMNRQKSRQHEIAQYN